MYISQKKKKKQKKHPSLWRRSERLGMHNYNATSQSADRHKIYQTLTRNLKNLHADINSGIKACEISNTRSKTT